jgi:hypothetical protein
MVKIKCPACNGTGLRDVMKNEEEEIFKLVKQKDTGEYFPVTVYTDTRGNKRYSDGIWWFLTHGVSALSASGKTVVFEPEPESNEIVVDFGFGKCKLKKRNVDTDRGSV